MTAPEPGTPMPVRSVDTDWLLDLLTSTANAGDFTVAVTLWTPAGIVSGDLVGAPVWIRLLREQVRTSGAGQAAVFAGDLEQVEQHILRTTADPGTEPLSFLHLADARTLLPSGEVFEHGLWRGRFVDVAGWTLGRV
ncbi:MAG TPA: hypothetical protein VNU66_00825 [Mycobacteriales bacterium]|nr:hypothetical protein [Mycobacteriales bacterium]